MQSFGASKEFLKDKESEWEVVGDGIKRKIMGYDDTIMMVNVFSKKEQLVLFMNIIIHKLPT